MESNAPAPPSPLRRACNASSIEAAAHTPSGASRHLPRFAEKGRRLRSAALAVLLAAPAHAFAFPATPKVAPACVAVVNAAALEAMNRTNPLGQMQIFGGDPTVFNPHLLRVSVRVFGGRTEIYSVDVAIDDSCRVLSASTRLETNEWAPR